MKVKDEARYLVRSVMVVAVLSLALAVALASFCYMTMRSTFSVDLVIAHYKEDLSWLSRPELVEVVMPHLRTVWVYGKGGVDPLETIGDELIRSKVVSVPLPNVGREAHSHLYHMLSQRRGLASVTVFMMGSSDAEHKWLRVMCCTRRAVETRDTALCGVRGDHRAAFASFVIDDYRSTNQANAAHNPESSLQPSPIRPFGRWLDAMFGEGTQLTSFATNSIFAASRTHILQNPTGAMWAILRQLETSSSPEVGHYVERAWEAILAPLPDACK
jgi:hypothetical protein